MGRVEADLFREQPSLREDSDGATCRVPMKPLLSLSSNSQGSRIQKRDPACLKSHRLEWPPGALGFLSTCSASPWNPPSPKVLLLQMRKVALPTECFFVRLGTKQ